MFTLLTGRVVHAAESVQRMMILAMTRQAPLLASIAPGIPRDVAHIVDRALAFRSDDRWPDAATMLRAVRTARAKAFAAAELESPSAGALSLEQTNAAVASDSSAQAKSRRGIGAAIAVSSILLLGAVGAVISFRGRAVPHAQASAAPAPVPTESVDTPIVSPSIPLPSTDAITPTAEPIRAPRAIEKTPPGATSSTKAARPSGAPQSIKANEAPAAPSKDPFDRRD